MGTSIPKLIRKEVERTFNVDYRKNHEKYPDDPIPSIHKIMSSKKHANHAIQTFAFKILNKKLPVNANIPSSNQMCEFGCNLTEDSHHILSCNKNPLPRSKIKNQLLEKINSFRLTIKKKET